MTKFEVGKKYIYDNRKFIEECLAVTDEFAWLQAPGYRGSIVDRVHDGWKEYKKPRTVERWMNIYERPSGPRFGEANWLSRDEAIKWGGQRSDYIDTIKITWTEGQ